MFIKVKRSGYTRDGEQFCSGRFLILMRDKNEKPAMDNSTIPPSIKYNVRGIVRYVAMRQLGHFMMGSARIGNKRIVLSGAYGQDGLLCDVDTDTFNMGTPLPEELYNAWAHGGGWNSAGSEAPLMREWAKTLV